ncbi:IS66 family transposase [Tropicibacter oceani]|uniref:Transposase n=1 Tax=Tropicibacter oceani TaxID=3058420 RepID=A0ABY8QKF3_9RHOB|nr:transposase [Tropicibacter oceani]WGW04302.1 transposase [Tropicibacter oceani]
MNPSRDLCNRAPVAQKVVSLYQELYAIEQEIAWSDHETRARLRQERAASVFDQITDICRSTQQSVEPASLLGKAIAYFLRHEAGLRTYLTDGRIEIDNNAVERAIRKIALVRKNSQFAGSEMAADVWMLFASLVATCEVNDIDPRRYLFWLCFKASQSKVDNIPFGELLPWHFAEAEARGDRDHLKFMDFVSGHTGPRYRDVKPGRSEDPIDT